MQRSVSYEQCWVWERNELKLLWLTPVGRVRGVVCRKKKRSRVQLSNLIRCIVYCESVVKSINDAKGWNLSFSASCTRDIRRVRGVTQVQTPRRHFVPYMLSMLHVDYARAHVLTRHNRILPRCATHFARSWDQASSRCRQYRLLFFSGITRHHILYSARLIYTSCGIKPINVINIIFDVYIVDYSPRVGQAARALLAKLVNNFLISLFPLIHISNQKVRALLQILLEINKYF